MTQLADWLGACEIDLSKLNFKAIEVGVDASRESTTKASLPELVRIAHRLAPREPGFLKTFRKPFREQDPTLLLDGEDELAAALSGAVLMRLLETESAEAHTAALLVSSASFAGWEPAIGTLQSSARDRLEESGEQLRERKGIPEAQVPLKDLEEAISQIATHSENNHLPQMKQLLPDTLRALRDGIQKTKTAATKAARTVIANQLRTDEELDILWWITAGHSRLLRVPFRELPDNSLPILAGMELATLTRFVPGPPAADAYLAASLRSGRVALDQELSIGDSAGALPTELPLSVPRIVQNSPEFAPVSFAVTRSREVTDTSWRRAFGEITGIDAGVSFRAIALAQQAYCECLLAKISGQE